ncbi:MAG TPA: GerMN domain-containing protein [Luteitalea sp.]|nr:GerMN domain-containing protein [Luteitalea sp.]
MRRPLAVILLGAITALLIGVVGFVYVPRWFAPATVVVPSDDSTSGGDAAGRIRASLFYVAEDGLRLTAVDADVPNGATPADQVRALVESQLQPAPAPLAQAIAEGTKVRQIFVAEDATAFVDLSKEAVTNHRGGSLDELFAVYAIVNAVTVNLPAIKGVQILIDGQEVDTLAGHVDLRHPLTKNMRWVGDIEQDNRTQENGSQEDATQGGKAPAGAAPAATPQGAPKAPAPPAAPKASGTTGQ